MIEINLHLYGKPSWDLDIEGKNYLNPEIFRQHAEYMKQHLENIADILEKLQSNGWELAEAYGALYSINLYKDEIKTKKEAKSELQILGIDPNTVSIEEWNEEEYLAEI